MTSPNTLVRFEGSFDSDEQSVIRAAVAKVESAQDFPPVPDEFGAPWEASAREIPGQGRMLMANRLDEETPLIASTAEELADQIETQFQG